MTVDRALRIVHGELGLDPEVTVNGREIKCWVPAEEGARSKTYLTSGDCSTLAEAFEVLAKHLASEQNTEEQR